METTVELESSSVLGQLLTEMSEVFLKAEGYDDALAAAEFANAEMERAHGLVAEGLIRGEELKQQVAEAQEVAFQRGRQLDVAREHHDADQAHIRELQAQLDTARRSFGDAFVYGAKPGAGPNRANRPKLTAAQVGGIRSMVGNGSTIASVAKVYGVHPSTVSRIASGVYHKGEEHA